MLGLNILKLHNNIIYKHQISEHQARSSINFRALNDLGLKILGFSKWARTSKFPREQEWALSRPMFVCSLHKKNLFWLHKNGMKLRILWASKLSMSSKYMNFWTSSEPNIKIFEQMRAGIYRSDRCRGDQ